jgi:hypothetical protein
MAGFLVVTETQEPSSVFVENCPFLGLRQEFGFLD